LSIVRVDNCLDSELRIESNDELMLIEDINKSINLKVSIEIMKLDDLEGKREMEKLSVNRCHLLNDWHLLNDEVPLFEI
jgi:hypothetical protein